LVILKNYESVAANYTLYDEHRDDVVETEHSRGLHRQGRKYLAADVTIPASAFEAGKAYEISLAYLIHRPGSIAPGLKMRRYTLLYGGFERSDLPDFDCPLTRSESWTTEQEQAIFNKVLWSARGFLYPTEAESVEEFRDPIPARPGQTVSIDAFIHSTLGEQIPELPVAAVPFINGRPTGDRLLYLENNTLGRTGYRDSFEVTLPEKPGLYYIDVAVFLHAFQVAETVDAELIEKHLMRGAENAAGMSGLVYRVEEQ
jgi:hypothetical protein